MKTLLITGAEGFVGQHLVEHLAAQGYEIVGGVRNRARKLAFEKKWGRALVCEISDAINVARVVASAKPDGVIHLAGPSAAYLANGDPLTAYQSIVSGWANLMDGVRRSAPRARLLLISAADVYGDAVSQDGSPRPIGEATELKPTGTFGALKATAESLAHTYFQNYHLNLTIARPFTYLGTNAPEATFFGSLAHRLSDWNPATQGSALALPDLDCVRDVLHVRDVVTAYELLLQEGRPNHVYNVCSGQPRSVRDICQALTRTRGLNLTLSAAPSTDEHQIRWQVGDNTALRGLNWTPQASFEDAIRDLAASCEPAAARV